jgi:ABC-type phosphate/phosphonate transport system substrate-binding protein
VTGRSVSSRESTVLVGAVAYHPRIVTIWEGFRDYFAAAGAPTDYLLYSNYERLVEALLSGEVDIGWNTNTAYVAAETEIGGDAHILGMRDVDADFRTVVVTRKGEAFDTASELAGKRLALGSRDSGHAAILPLHYLAAEGLDAATETTLVRFDTDLGKHGDTGDSEFRVVRAVADGDADAGAIGDATWAVMRSEGFAPAGDLEVAWRSPVYYHCNFTALPSFDRGRAARWSEALLAMRYDDPELRAVMDLEGVKRWLPGDKSGYADLTLAMKEQGYLG